MSKVKKKMIYALLLVVTFLSVTTVNAAGKNIGVSDFSVKDKSGTITVEDPVITDNLVTSNITFNEVGDFVTFKLVLKNNENEKYKIESITDNNTNKNLTIDYTFSKDFINTGETSTVEIKLTYKNKLINQDKISLNDLTIKINLVNEDGKSENIIINPTTGDTILHYLVLLIIALTGLILSVNKKKIKGMKIGNLIIVLAIILTPFAIFAKEKYEVQIKFNDIDIIGEYETYNITIDPKNGDPAVTKQITYGEKIGALPTNPTKDGYTFDKWVDNKGNTVTEDTTITGPISIEAKYNIVKYDITYNLDGGSVSGNPTKYTIEDTITLKNPSKQGYTFAGWTGTEIDTQTTSVTIPVGSTGARNYVAHYSASEDTAYTVIHKFAKLTEGYDIEEVTEHGTTGSTVPAPRKTRTGFVTPSVQNVTIAADGSASVTYIYERETYAFSITDRTYIDASSTEDGTYPYGTQITAKAVARPGYDFVWSDGETALSRTFELESAKELAPVYTAKTNTPYKVIHRKQKVTLDGYVEADTQNLTGTTDTEVTPSVNTYTGFTSPSTQTVTIDGNGSTVVTYDYDRETYAFSITDRTYIDHTSAVDGNYPYEKEITVKALERAGYGFKWSDDDTNYEKTITITGPVTLAPIYTADENTPYTVKHMKQKINGDYELADTDNLTGTTDTEITPSVKTYEGFTSPSTQTTTISGDGHTLVTYNYTRNKYALTITHPEYVEEDKSGNYYYEEKVTLTAIDRQGYTFAGWSSGENTKTITVTMGDSDITVEPLYTSNTDTTYKVIHKYAKLTSGYDIEEVTGTGTTDTTIPAPIKHKTGFVDPTTQNITITGDGEASVTYTYQREEYTFTISDRTYLDNTSTPNGTYPYETEITLKATAREGYTFKWSDNVTDLERTFNLTSTTTLSLDYTANTYYVHFDKNDELAEGTMPNQEFTYGTAENLDASAFTKTGYTFTGWNTQSDGEGTPYSDEAEVNNLLTTGTLNLYAQWIANTNTPYKVIHKKQNVDLTTYTDVEENYTGTSDASITPTVNTYTGFTKPNAQTTTISRFGTTVVTYVYDRLIYTVSFNTAGGSTVNDQEIPYGGKVTQPADPTKTNYTFAGWYADSGFNTEFDFTNTEIEDTTTIYAKFVLNTYTVTAYGNNGLIESTSGWTGTGTSATKDVEENTAIGTLPEASRSGYVLTGWNTKADGSGTNVTTSTTISASTSIYAQWIVAQATFDTGKNVCAKMKKLSGQTSATYSTENTTITNIEKSSTKPDISSFTSDNIVSTNTSVAPIYMWYDNGTIYWWSEDSIPDLNTDSSFMFSRLKGLTDIDMSSINTINVTKMNDIFLDCSSLTALNLGDNFDTSKVTDMSYMFSGCSSLTALNLGDKFDTSQVTNMEAMFKSCRSLTSLNLGVNFDTSNVTNMNSMFLDCSSLTALNLGDKFDTSQVTIINAMFSGCSSLTTLDLSSFDTSKVTNMRGMFYLCTSLTTLDLGDNFDTSQVTDMYLMFSYCTSLTTLDLGEKFDTKNVTNMSKMFPYAENLVTIYAPTSFVTTNVTNSIGMFYNNNNLVGGAGTRYTIGEKNAKYAHIDEGTSNPGYFTARPGTTYTVTAYANTGSIEATTGWTGTGASATKEVAHGDTISTLPEASRSGYVLTGWNTAADGTGTNVTSSTTVSAALPIYAQWIINTYTVTFDTDGGSTVSDQTVGYGSTATRPGTNPTKTGYVFDDWYTTDQYTTKFDFTTPITGDTTIYAHFEELKVCANNENITRLSENTCSANENITVGDGIVCKRAVKLHEETCSQTSTSGYCSGAGYTESGSKGTSTITYGSCGTSGTLTSGDAFTCDVNGDEKFDELTERFYYVSDYYDTSAKGFDSGTAVLIYYNNVTSGVSCNKNTFAYDSSNENWHGPRTLVSQLPTTSQWSNVELKNTTRQILTQTGTTSTSGGTLPTDFSYEGYAARFITAQELNSACGITIGSYRTGELDSCNYIMENTEYAKSSIGNLGPWLETPRASNSGNVWSVFGDYRSVGLNRAHITSNFGARPAIEVPKSAIAIGTQSKYTVSFDSDGGSAISDIEVNPGDSIDELPTPTKADSIFVGWFEDESDTDPVTEPYTPSGDITLIAKWNNIICKKATTLHTETCNQTDGSKFCSGYGYTTGDTITYGNIISSDTYQGGDAFDCDVDGTGYNQRFYYLRTKDNKAVLISNKNFTAASKQADQNISFIYSQAHDQLPTTSDWGNLPVKFDGKPARLITMEDLLTVTNSSSSSDITPIGSLKGYEFLFESSNFSGIGERSTQWLEEISSTKRYRYRNDQYHLAQVESGKENTSKNPVRPVIEVPTDLIEDAYIVKFNANGGTSDTYVKVQKGSTIGTLPTATKTGYVLDTWYTNLNFTEPVTVSTIPNGYVTYFAKWVKPVEDMIIDSDTYTLEVGEADSITIIDPEEIEPRTYLSNDTSVVTVDSNGNIEGVGEGSTTITITGTRSGTTKTITATVYAQLTDFTVSFDSQGGSTVEDMTVPINTAIGSLPDDPTKTDHTFGGWFTNTNYSTQVTVDTIIRGNVTFHAKWIPNDAVAEINNTFYTTLQAAVDDAPTTKTTIILLKNVEVTSPIDMSNKNTDKDIILDLNGYTLSTGSSAPNKTNVIKTKAKLEVKNGTISSAKNDALIDVEGSTSYLVLREDITLISTGGRACVYNTGGNALIDGNASLTSNAEWTSSMKRGTVQTLTSGVTTIKGGTIINNRASSSYAVAIELGTVTIGTEDGIYDIQNLIMQGETNGIYAAVNYSLYDGMIKGKTAAVNDESKITGIETGATKVNDTDSGYNRLYYTLPVSKYKVTLNANGGEVDPTYINVDAGDQVGTLPTPTRGLYTFDGWWTDYSGGTQVTSSYEPTVNVEIIARWHYNSTTDVVNFNMNNDAIETYANYISSWKDLSQSTFQANMMDNMNANSCSKCDQPNSCNNPTAGTLCDQSVGYNTGVSSDLKVYTSDETTKTKGSLVSYTTSSNGIIYNMIPGETYYWEAADDSTVYGIVKANGYRRLIKSPVRNVRDLGGLAVDTDGDGTSDGRIKYGILFRGAQLSSNQSDATSLQKLGITRELDLRPNSEGKDKGQAVLPKYDIDTPGSEQDVIMHNYLISYSSHPDYYTELRNTIKTVMNYVVEDDDSIYFHCTIGTDRTGTLAYFLEGLLGVSEEDRLEDYELSYYFGMTNRDRYHDNLQNSSINPRFTTMYNTYNTNAKIYEWFMNENPNITQAEKDADEILLSRFRQKMIE